MRGVRSISLAYALAFCACSDDVQFLSLAGLESSLVVLVRVGADRTVLDATIVDRPSGPTYFAAETGDTLHAFSLDQENIRNAEGRPLASDELTALTVDFLHDEVASTSCAPCPFPAGAPPFVLEPGSRCTLPPFFAHRQNASAELNAMELESIRATIHIVRPGACECPALDGGPVRGRFTTCEVEPGAKPHRWHQVAISDDGGIAAVHPSMVLTATAGAPPAFHPLESAFIRSPALTGIGTRGRRFLAVGRTLTIQSDTPEESFVRLDGDAIDIFDPLRELGELVNVALYDPARSNVFLLGQSNAGNEARVWRCNDAVTSCASTELARCGSGPSAATKNIANATLLPSGDIVAMTLDAHLFQLRPESDAWECRASDRSMLRLEGALEGRPIVLRVDSLADVLVAEDRLFACGHGGSVDDPAPAFSLVLNTRVSLSEPQWHNGEIRVWGDEAQNARCHALWHDRANGEVFAFFFRGETADVFAFDVGGRFLGRREGRGLSAPDRAPRFAELDEPVTLVVDSPDRRTRLIAGVSGALRAQRDDGPLIAVGGDAPKQPAFAIAGDEALILGGMPVSWSGGCDSASLTPRAPLDQHIQAAAALPDRRVAAFSRDEAAIYDRREGVTERWPLALPALESAAAITNEEVIVLDSGGTAHIVSLSQRSLRRLPLLSAPGVASDRAIRFQYLSGARGLGWLSGGRELARVRAGADGLQAELWWGARVAEMLAINDDPLEVDAYSASAVLCGGRTVMFVRAVLRNLSGPQYLARTVLLEPTLEGDYQPRVLPGFSDQARFGSSSFVHVADHISASANPVLVFGDGLVLRPDSDPFYAANPDITSIVEVGDQIVLTDRAGLRVFLRAP